MKKISTILFFLLVVSSQLLFAQKNKENDAQNPILTDNITFDIGVFIPVKSVKISVNGFTDNDEIDFGNSFDFQQNEATPYFNFNWRFSKMWKLSAEYFGLKTSQSAELEDDIIWNEITFKEGSYVKGGFTFDLYRIYVGRVILKREKHELGGGIGIHGINLGAYIEGEAYINDISIGIDRSSVKGFIPLPNIGIWYIYAPSSKWILSAKIDWFGLKANEYSGLLWDIDPTVGYQITDYFGVNLSYRYFEIDARVDQKRWDGQVKLKFHGPAAGVYFNF